MIEITDSPFLAILVACSLPLLLVSLIIVPILVTRLRLREIARIKQNQKQGLYDESLIDKKLKLPPRTIMVCGLFLTITMFIGLLLVVYWIGKTVGFDNQSYLFGIVAPLVCSIPMGALLLLFIHKRIHKK
jgi:hypothetical protein